uniref:Peptidase S54 rhomboid domain-containing protein n=1 Tax=Physcomitrium patens TaxID=3218 RepID=A0A7I4BQF8_PHYPA
MGRPLIYDILDRPASTCVIAICSATWLYIQQRNVGYSDVGLSYESVISQGQYWRFITSAFSHISFLHLVFNMSALWSLGVVESFNDYNLGTAYYIQYTTILVLLSGLMVLGMYHVLITRAKLEYYRRVTAVGYSCVVFGWMTILAVRQPSLKLNLFGLLSLPISLAPFESLIFTSIIVPQASFLGHLAGILVGYLIGWGVVQGMTIYWAATLTFWIALGFVWSLSRTTSFQLPYLEVDSVYIYKLVRSFSNFARKQLGVALSLVITFWDIMKLASTFFQKRCSIEISSHARIQTNTRAPRAELA